MNKILTPHNKHTGYDYGLVFHLPMTGTPVNEKDIISGLSFTLKNGTVTSSTDAPPHNIGSYQFDGSSWIEAIIPNNLYPVLLTSGCLSISYWFKQTTATGYLNTHFGIGIPDDVSSGQGSTVKWELVNISSNGTSSTNLNWTDTAERGYYVSSSDIHSASAPSLNTWHNVICTLDRNSLANLYLDGTLVGSKSVTNKSNIPLTGAVIRLGRSTIYTMYTTNSWGWSEPFVGFLSDLRIYKRVLTSEEISLCNTVTSTSWSGDIASTPGIYDSNSGVYNIYTPEHFTKMLQVCNKTEYANKTFKIQANLNFNSKSISSINLPSGTTLDGNHYSVNIAPVINTNYGLIKNLTNTGSPDMSSSTESGGICRINEGVIKGCKNTADLVDAPFSPYTDLGGICGKNKGTIESCINYGNINATTNIYRLGNIGGISGVNNTVSTSTIINCVNFGIINAQNTVINASGISCNGGGESSTTKNCCNLANITSISGSYTHVGGISSGPASVIQNCVYSGTLVSNSNKFTGSIIGFSTDSYTSSSNYPTLTNCFTTATLGTVETSYSTGKPTITTEANMYCCSAILENNVITLYPVSSIKTNVTITTNSDKSYTISGLLGNISVTLGG